jgi:hypothetical protein
LCEREGGREGGRARCDTIRESGDTTSSGLNGKAIAWFDEEEVFDEEEGGDVGERLVCVHVFASP